MVDKGKMSKTHRVLNMYERFNRGEKLKKSEMIKNKFYDVDEKTIRRDIQELNRYFEINDKTGIKRKIIISKGKYEMLNKAGFKFSDKDIYALSKIILESRAFSKIDMERILNILNSQCEDNKVLRKIISNEEFNYIPPRHNKNIIDMLWEISTSIQNKRIVDVEYFRQDGKKRKYKLNPMGLIFSEYYFYLIAEFTESEKHNSVVFRVDRFKKYTITDDVFNTKDLNEFEESEFHKRIQFMYTGELMTIKFKFWGDSLEAILDRLPTAEIEKYDENNIPILKARIYGEGVKRWILSQKEFLEVLEPESYRNEIKDTIRRMYELYK